MEVGVRLNRIFFKFTIDDMHPSSIDVKAEVVMDDGTVTEHTGYVVWEEPTGYVVWEEGE